MVRRNALSVLRRVVAAGVIGALVFALFGCARFNKRQEGAVVGAGVGGAIGAVVGNQTGSTARGAIIGAVIGGTAGVIIGNQMDQQAKELKQTIAGATIERVGEGIQVTFASGLLYEYDSDQVLAAAGSNLRSLASSLGKFPNTDLLIVGYTDAVGLIGYNQALSLRRASAASAFLITQGVDAGRLRTSGRGELEPVATNDTEAGRQLNRRVEIAIFANASAKKSGGY
jgi:outer membrane protein OmpA-like peptidoglycan-associated protein